MIKDDEDMDEIVPSLYVGTEQAARNYAFLQKMGISYVLNVSDIAREIDPAAKATMHFEQVPLSDFGVSDLKANLQPCYDFINEGLKKGSKVLVHCQVGCNRSPTVVIAYLMKFTSSDLKSCCEKVKRARTAAWPVEQYLKQLVDLETTIFSKSSAKYDDLVAIFKTGCVNRFKSDLFKNFKQPEFELQSQ